MSSKQNSKKQLLKAEKKVVRDVVKRQFVDVPKSTRKAAKALVAAETAKTSARIVASVKAANRPAHEVQSSQIREQLEETLAVSICSPGSVAGIRFPDLSSKRTAVAQPFEILPTSFNAAFQNGASQVGRMLLQNEGLGFTWKNPLRTAVIYDSNAAGQGSNYQLPTNFNIPVGTGKCIVDQPYLVPGSGFTAWHGPRLYAGNVTGHEGSFFWCDQGEALFGQLSNSSGVNTLTWNIILDGYIAGQGIAPNIFTTGVSTLVAGANPWNLGISIAGYYRMTFNFPNGAPNGTVTCNNFSIVSSTGSASVSHFRHLALRDLVNNASAADEIRMIGQSLMYSNFNTELNLGGQVAGLQTGGQDLWMNYIPPSNAASVVSIVQSSMDSSMMNASTGLYGYLKPVDTRDFDFQDMYETGTDGSMVDAGYNLDSTGGFLVIAVSQPSVGATSGTWTVRSSIEYTTRDVWRNTDVSIIPDDVARKAIDRTRYVQQFHENPKHIKEIFQEIGNQVKGAARFLYDNRDSIKSGLKAAGEIAMSVIPMMI